MVTHTACMGAHTRACMHELCVTAFSFQFKGVLLVCD